MHARATLQYGTTGQLSLTRIAACACSSPLACSSLFVRPTTRETPIVSYVHTTDSAHASGLSHLVSSAGCDQHARTARRTRRYRHRQRSHAALRGTGARPARCANSARRSLSQRGRRTRRGRLGRSDSRIHSTSSARSARRTSAQLSHRRSRRIRHAVPAQHRRGPQTRREQRARARDTSATRVGVTATHSEYLFSSAEEVSSTHPRSGV